MEELYKEIAELIQEVRVNNYYVQAWIDEGMPEVWAPNALRCTKKVKELTSRIVQLSGQLLKEEA